MMQLTNVLGRSVSGRQCAPVHAPCQHAMQKFVSVITIIERHAIAGTVPAICDMPCEMKPFSQLKQS